MIDLLTITEELKDVDYTVDGSVTFKFMSGDMGSRSDDDMIAFAMSNFKDVNNLNNSVLFHLGLDTALSEVTLPITLSVNGKNRIMKLQFDLNKMYNSPQIDFNVDNNRMSNPGEENWMSSMKLNTTDAFSFLSVE